MCKREREREREREVCVCVCVCGCVRACVLKDCTSLPKRLLHSSHTNHFLYT